MIQATVKEIYLLSFSQFNFRKGLLQTPLNQTLLEPESRQVSVGFSYPFVIEREDIAKTKSLIYDRSFSAQQMYPWLVVLLQNVSHH